MPSFWIGLILLWLFAFTLDWFPLRGFSDPAWTAAHVGFVAGRGPNDGLFQIVDLVMHGAMPMLALVLISAGGTILLLQTPTLEVVARAFVVTACARGLSK